MALIGLISDVHATAEPVAEALNLFDSAGVDQILCAGDIAGYNNQLEKTIELLQQYHCQSITGNHDLLYIDHHSDEPESASFRYLADLPDSYTASFNDKTLYMVHAQPPAACHGGIKLRDKHGTVLAENIEHWSEVLKAFDYDVLIVGHTHQVFVEQIAGTLVINPGSSVFNNCCALLQLPEMQVELFALSGQAIKKTWNWGEHMIDAQ